MDWINKLTINIVADRIAKGVLDIIPLRSLIADVRKIERIGVLSSNIAEEIILNGEAKVLKHEKRKNLMAFKQIKNLLPKTIALYVSLILALMVSLIDFAFHPILPHFLLLFLIVFVFGYFLFFYALEVFIYRKIKLIYKSIHNLKLGKDIKDSMGENIGADALKEVEIEVQNWAENKKREIDDLKKMEKFRKEFLANLSHELKTPIFNIQGYIHTLVDGAYDDPKVLKHFLERTAKSVDRLNNLVDDLDEISKIETGELVIFKETFNIHQLIKDIFESMELKAKMKNITFSIKKGCDKHFYVNADKEKIRQLITNLIDNSIKYGKENGGTVVGFYDMDENILIEITDNGIGISEEHLPRLFERFYRIDKHRSREQGGTGLGLAIVKHIIEAHQQTINVRSRTGVGTTFAFTLEMASDK